MSGIVIGAKVAKEILDWVSEHSENITAEEIRINFIRGEVELYDYESGNVLSHRPLSWFYS